MKITFLWQSSFLIQTKQKTIGIDIWLENPIHPLTISDIPTLDYACCTHDHFDHGFQTMMEFARRDDVLFLSGYEMMNHAKEKWCQTGHANVWWLFSVDDDLEFALTPALHSSNTGQPVWLLFVIEGKTIYHMGDTAYMSEFSMIRDVYAPDIVMIPIGGRYTMGIPEAAYALDVLQPRIAIPMHYDTFPGIAQDPHLLQKKMNTDTTHVQIMKPWQSYESV